MAKRALAAGCRLRKDGKYEVRFSLEGKRYSVYGSTQKECREKELELREQIKKGLYVNNRNITLDQYYEEWKKSRIDTVKGSTERGINSRYITHIKPVLGARKLVDLEKREIVILQQKLAESKKASTVNLIMSNLKNILNDAVAEGILIKSPAANIKPLRIDDKPARETIHRALTVEEQRLFMDYVKDEWLYELLALLLCTGMRIGEATALTWQDIDYKNNVIHITKSISTNSEGRYIVGTPKNKSSIRDIPINENIKNIIKSQKGKFQLLNGNLIKLDQIIFTGTRGAIIYNIGINRVINNAIDRMHNDGIKIERFSVHAFRDTFATRYIEQGGSPHVLKTILGHSSLAMTMDLYSQVLPNIKQEEMDNIKIAF